MPEDLPERNETLFRARVTMAICRFDLDDHVGAADALRTAEQADPAKAKLDAEFLMAGGLLEDREVPALRLLASAVERDPSLARARYEHARLHERLLRKREVFEPAVANAVDEEYASVLAIDPANVSAWANRAYVAWLLSSADPGEELDSSETPSWRRRAVSSLKAGREYKDVRAETMVGELDWNLARVAAEEVASPTLISTTCRRCRR